MAIPPPFHVGTDTSENPVWLDVGTRTRHVYVIGQTGVGKSTLLRNMILHDILSGTGCCFIDPHGDDAYDLLSYIPPERLDDVIYFNAGDRLYSIAFNIFNNIPPHERETVAYGFIAALKHIFANSWSESRMAYLATNTAIALTYIQDATILAVRLMIEDATFRAEVLEEITNTDVLRFWKQEFPGWTDQYLKEAVPPIMNKLCQFFSSPLLLTILGQTSNALDLETIMQEGKILIVNLAEGRLGDTPANLLGSLFITKFYQSAMRRVDIPVSDRRQFHLYVDEFTDFTAAESFSRMLSGARKFALGLTLAHQYTGQMSETVQDAVFGTVGTHMSFRVLPQDTAILEKVLPNKQPQIEDDLENLDNHTVRARLLTPSGKTTEPITLTTSLGDFPYHGRAETIIDNSRSIYGTPMESAQQEVKKRWYPNLDSFQAIFD